MKIFMKKIIQKQLIAILVILASFSVLIANAQEGQIVNNENSNEFALDTSVNHNVVVDTESPSNDTVPATLAPAVLEVCDHNGDGVRNLTDVVIFSGCKDTFDADHNGSHDLTDVALYTANNQDAGFCNNDFICTPDPVGRRLPVNDITPVPATTTTTVAVCDHNNDNVRNLTDVAMFATCKDTFDVNGDNKHDLTDLALYTANNQDDAFCANNFVCDPSQTLSVENTPVISGGVSNSVAVCDHNNDNVRNLTDVAMFASCKDTFDMNNDGKHDLTDLALYTENNQDDTFCKNNFKCEPDKVIKPSVLGEQVKNCKIDQDVIGQTQWADGSLIRGCDMKVYRIENQKKYHIKSLKELFKYIGQRIHNVADEVVDLF